jgi:hypothetical protein
VVGGLQPPHGCPADNATIRVFAGQPALFHKGWCLVLTHVDSDQIFRELVSLRIACNPQQNHETLLWRSLHDAVKRLRALLPDDLVMTDGATSRVGLERLRLYLDKWDEAYGLSVESGEADGSDGLTREVQSLVEQFAPADLPEANVPTQGSVGDKQSRRTKSATVNERMAAKLLENPTRVNWTAKQWSETLGVTDAAIKQTTTWKNSIRAARALTAPDRAQKALKRAGRDIGR